MALTVQDAKIVVGMNERGDENHDIAAWFGESQAKIVDVIDGVSHGQLAAANDDELHPVGAPGPKALRLRSDVIRALDALDGDDFAKAKAVLREGLTKFNAHDAK